MSKKSSALFEKLLKIASEQIDSIQLDEKGEITQADRDKLHEAGAEISYQIVISRAKAKLDESEEEYSLTDEEQMLLGGVEDDMEKIDSEHTFGSSSMDGDDDGLDDIDPLEEDDEDFSSVKDELANAIRSSMSDEKDPDDIDADFNGDSDLEGSDDDDDGFGEPSDDDDDDNKSDEPSDDDDDDGFGEPSDDDDDGFSEPSDDDGLEDVEDNDDLGDDVLMDPSDEDEDELI